MEFSLYKNKYPLVLELLLALLLLSYCIFKRIKAKTLATLTVPSPSWAWPIIGHLHLLAGHGGEPVCKILGSLADKYGPIYSLKVGRHPTIFISSWEMVKECFTKNDRVLATRPSIAAGKYLLYQNASFALSPYGDYWRHIRKIATTELLTGRRLENLNQVQTAEVDRFIRDLNSFCEEKVTLSELIEQFTLNITLKLIAGKRFSSEEYEEEGSDGRRIKKAIMEAIYLSGVFVVSDALPWLEWFDIDGHVGSMKKTAKEIDSVIGKWVNEHLQKRLEKRKESDGEDDDFIDVLLSKLEEDVVVSGGYTRDTVVKATAMILIFTGAESTSVVLTWALSLLVNHPKMLKAAQEEIDIHVGREKWVEESDIKNLKFLQAFLKETLRLYPPGPVTGPREAMEDCNIGNYHIAKGTRVIVYIWKLHRDARMWEDPCEFKPERFMNPDAAADIDFQDHHFEYIPFSFGRRSCPGMKYGLHVASLTLARLLQGFDLTTAGGMEIDMQEGLGLALPKLNPLQVFLKPRLKPDLYL